MANKTTHFGRAGEFFAMSELLLRGWNVAVPVVDVGDDVFVIDDNDKATYRLQVKTASAERRDAGYRAVFRLSRKQLATQYDIELFYFFLVRVEEEQRWRHIIIPREDLHAVRRQFETAERSGPGARPRSEDNAKSDGLRFEVTIATTNNDVRGWSAPLLEYVDRWPDALSSIENGPGTRSESA